MHILTYSEHSCKVISYHEINFLTIIGDIYKYNWLCTLQNYRSVVHKSIFEYNLDYSSPILLSLMNTLYFLRLVHNN